MSPDLDDAVARLGASLDFLEGAVSRRLDAASRGGGGDIETELQLMQDDRARLAVELESATARLSRLETASNHIGPRLASAIGAIREVLVRSGATVAGS